VVRPCDRNRSEQQHKYGPFAPIRAAIAKLKAEQKGTPTR